MAECVSDQHQDCPCRDCRIGLNKKPYRKRVDKSHGRVLVFPVAKPSHEPKSRLRPAGSRQKRIHSSLQPQELLPATVFMDEAGSPGTIRMNIYPIEKTESVNNTMQYFFEVFAGSIHPMFYIPVQWQPKQFYDNNYKQCITDLGWFSATFAFAEAMKQRTLTGNAQKSSEIIKHSAQGVVELRKKILKGKTGVDDLAILTITSLMTLDMVTREVRNWKMHIEGLEQILALRGGIDSLDDYIKYKVIGFQTFWLYKQMVISSGTPEAVYPKHPFPPELCVAISKLPIALEKLALKGTLNKSLITLMADVASICQKYSGGADKAREDLRRLYILAYEMEELLTVTSLDYLETVVLLATNEYCLTVGQDRKTHWLLVGSLQCAASWLMQGAVAYEEQHHNVLVWAGATMIATEEPQAQVARLGRKILSRCQKQRQLSRDDILFICHRFLWDNGLTALLDEKLSFTEKLSMKPETAEPTPATSSFSDTAPSHTPDSGYDSVL